MEISPITDSTELRIPHDLLLSAKPTAVISTAAKDVSNTHGLKWWLDCYPNSHKTSAGVNTAGLFVIYMRVSHMPVKCKVKYTIGNISETTDVFCSKLMEPTILSISRDVLLIQETADDGLTFKCEVTFNFVPKGIGIPVPKTQSRSVTSTITIPVCLQNHRDLYETPEYPIDKDGKLVWWILGRMYKTKKGTQIKICMRTSAANCNVMLTCVHAASDTYRMRENGIRGANRNTDYCNTAFYLAKNVYDKILEIKCTAAFTFRYLIQIYVTPHERSVAIESLIRRPTTAKSVNKTKDDSHNAVQTLTDGFHERSVTTESLIQRPTKSTFPSQYDANGYHKLPNLNSLTPRQFLDQYTKPVENVAVSGNESDDTSEYTSSEDGDGSDEEDGMTDQERLAYRLRRQNEETIAVQKLLAKIKNVPMIAEGSTF